MLTFRTVWVFALWAHFFLDHAETRWCNALGKGPADTLNYSAIAKAARVTGVIIARVTSMPSGKVLQVEPVFHVHPLLLDPVENKLESWAIKTDAVGEERCQCLIIVEFQLRDNVSPTEPPLPPTPLGILRLRVSAETIILYSLPGNSAQQQETEMASLYSTAPLCVGNGAPNSAIGLPLRRPSLRPSILTSGCVVSVRLVGSKRRSFDFAALRSG